MDQLSLNVAIYATPFIAPALLMIAAHYFPWSATAIGRLSENQARVYGVVGIILPVMASGALGEAIGITLSFWKCIELIWIAALSAGSATVWVWSIDAQIQMRREYTEAATRAEALKDYAEAQRDI